MKNDTISNTLNPDVHWPAVICYHGDDELIYVADEAGWQENTQGDTSIIEGEDNLIDSKGQVFNLTEHKGKLRLMVTNKRILLVDLLLLIQQNACLVQ
ncbi:DUF4144 domain-containing protein [Shewanella surugensis]|uniref:DUF4144 domain-containing protein n=1 Tax=Shewanella surugensis TaxID=212020 RepID=A0ABT0L7Z4_9GAMM|nr:DUF4144 domain-containing protein [Shewanella surugensis]MCL1123770.1 DUF4144 domain-containing protein [Shewanella surugensis]